MQETHSTRLSERQVWETNTKRTPMAHARTTRVDQASVVTSSFGGKLVPIKAIPLLREDAMRTSMFTLNVTMAETAKMLLNPVRITAAAYLVPKLALERFKDMGSINRSYNGQQEIDGTVIPWFVPIAEPKPPTSGGITQTLGLHYNTNEDFNSDYIESYNAIWNHIAADRSPSLTPRDKIDLTLAPAFWAHTQMKYVKPTFDDAMIAGEVPLSVVNTEQIVRVKNSMGGATGSFLLGQYQDEPTKDNFVSVQAALTDQLYTEMDQNGIVISLANIDLARETAAWARARTQFQGLSEEWMMDQLLSGIRLRDEVLNAPILLDTAETIVGMSQRYATDAANLDKSVTDGQTQVQLRCNVPQLECGGVVMIVAQALPEMVYERQRDYYFAAKTVNDLPDRTADELDPQPVALVRNSEIDESHSLPDDLFGYAPLNHQWQRVAPNIGGKYYRADPAAQWNEDRNRIWTSEVVDPALGPDFYLSTTLSHEVFASTNEDPFEWWLSGASLIEGLTYFGPAIREATGDYDKVLGQVDMTRVKGDGSDAPTPPPAPTP